MKQADNLTQPDRLDLLREGSEPSDISKQDGCGRGNMALLLDVTKRPLANRADVGVHLAAGDTKHAERQRKRATNRNGDMHLIPTTPADLGIPVTDRIHRMGGWHGPRPPAKA